MSWIPYLKWPTPRSGDYRSLPWNVLKWPLPSKKLMIAVVDASWVTISRAAVFFKEITLSYQHFKKQTRHQGHGVLHQLTGQWEHFSSMPRISHIIYWIFRKVMHVSCTFLVFEDIREDVIGKHIPVYYKLKNHKLHPYLFMRQKLFWCCFLKMNTNFDLALLTHELYENTDWKGWSTSFWIEISNPQTMKAHVPAS